MSTAERPIRIATRGSALALAQARLVLAQCRALLPDQPFELVILKTTGDKLLTASLAGGDLPKGLFTKELETALLQGEADLAVHSLKDLPTELPPGLTLGAVSQRADARDVLLLRGTGPRAAGLTLASLPQGATVGTSSPRRAAQVRDRRPDLRIVPLRGNVGTRLRKLAEQPDLDAIILAAAGLERLGLRLSPRGELQGPGIPAGLCGAALSFEEMLPAVGQAALGLEIRSGDARLASLCAQLNDGPTWDCVTAERAFLQGMGGGCHLAVAAHARCEGDTLQLQGLTCLGGQVRRGEEAGPRAQAAALGQALAQRLRG